MTAISRVTACRACGGRLGIPFCDLGSMPLANSYVAAEQAGQTDPVFPLNAVVCERCFLAQLDHVVAATEIFSDYAYFSSYSSSWVAHAAAFACDAIGRLGLNGASFVVEIASNDGYLLRNFVAAGVPCLGVEPAANVAEVAKASGVATRVEFFGRGCAAEIVRAHGHANLVIANNVLAHVPDVNDFVAGLAELAGPRGTVSIEAPHLLALLERVEFDTIYHEHYAYWSLHAMRQLLAAHGLQVHAVERLPTHGSSLRVWASADPDYGLRHGMAALQTVEALERRAGLHTANPYRGFEAKVQATIAGFRAWLEQAHTAGRTIAAYGAAAKGSTFLNACKVTSREIALVADRSPAKQGKLLPGSRIPVVTPEQLLATRPDVIVILPWNLADEIAAELRPVLSGKERLFVAVPEVRELG